MWDEVSRMLKFKTISGGVTSPKGFKAAGVTCGIKKSGRKDLAIVFSESPAVAAGIFTSNQMAAAPVEVSCGSLAAGESWQAVVVNSGNANACTGKQGYADAREMILTMAKTLDLEPETVLVASTGVIGEFLPMEKVKSGIRGAVKGLSLEGGSDAAEAIMTTDAYPKEIAVELNLEGKRARIGAMAKGAGMIAPELTCHPPLHATMLAVITTDATLSSKVDALKFLKAAADKSFNCISVDGDTSTNDSVFLLANGQAGANSLKFDSGEKDVQVFQEALDFVCLELAKSVVKDGEGATKLVTYRVSGAKSDDEAKAVARSVANSILVKTALFGRDPNWGRIVAAIGRSRATVAPSKVDVFFDDEKVVGNGTGTSFDPEKIKKLLDKLEIEIRINLGQDKGKAVFYGCDLTYDYVKINAEYRT